MLKNYMKYKVQMNMHMYSEDIKGVIESLKELWDALKNIASIFVFGYNKFLELPTQNKVFTFTFICCVIILILMHVKGIIPTKYDRIETAKERGNVVIGYKYREMSVYEQTVEFPISTYVYEVNGKKRKYYCNGIQRDKMMLYYMKNPRWVFSYGDMVPWYIIGINFLPLLISTLVAYAYMFIMHIPFD